MKNDPAVLFYIGDWLKSTAELDADTRGWYLNLLLHNYDKGSLPSDTESLATLAVVKFSEFNRFEHVFKMCLNKKFDLLEDGRISNPRINDILRKREAFTDKRSNAGKVSYLMKYFIKTHPKEYKNKDLRDFVKSKFDYNIDLKEKESVEHMFKHLFELYINENENEDINIIRNNKGIKIDFEKIKDSFNQNCPKLKKVIALSDTRIANIKARISDGKPEDVYQYFESVFQKVDSSDFLNGVNNNGWSATFDWIINKSNFIKIIEGNYDNTNSKTNGNGNFANGSGSPLVNVQRKSGKQSFVFSGAEFSVKMQERLKSEGIID